jgi:hypothetical protein
LLVRKSRSSQDKPRSKPIRSCSTSTTWTSKSWLFPLTLRNSVKLDSTWPRFPLPSRRSRLISRSAPTFMICSTTSSMPSQKKKMQIRDGVCLDLPKRPFKRSQDKTFSLIRRKKSLLPKCNLSKQSSIPRWTCSPRRSLNSRSKTTLLPMNKLQLMLVSWCRDLVTTVIWPRPTTCVSL